LIVLKVLIEGNAAHGLYNPGANISIITYHYFKKLNIEKSFSPQNLTFRATSGEKGATLLNIEKQKLIFIVDKKDFGYDFLIGLDTIMEFQLSQNHNCEISQDIPENNTVRKEKNQHSTEKSLGEIYINWDEYMPIEEFEIKTSHLDKNKQNIIFNLIEKYDCIC